MEETMELQNYITQFLETGSDNLFGLIRKVLLAAFIILCGKIITSISRKITQKAVSGKLHADETIASILRMVIQYGVFIICLIMILDLFGINTTGLIAMLGAAGVAVGFALRDTLSNIASGIIILFLRPFKKGEFIECDTISGTVQDMGLFSVILQTPDGIYISAPNSSLWGLPLKNYSRNPTRRLDIPITISYTDSIEKAFWVLRGIITQETRFLDEPAPQVMVQSLGELGTVVTIRAWVESGDYWPVNWAQMKNVKERIQGAGLTISLPRREIHTVKEGKAPSVLSKDSPKDSLDEGQNISIEQQR